MLSEWNQLCGIGASDPLLMGLELPAKFYDWSSSVQKEDLQQDWIQSAGSCFLLVDLNFEWVEGDLYIGGSGSPNVGMLDEPEENSRMIWMGWVNYLNIKLDMIAPKLGLASLLDGLSKAWGWRIVRGYIVKEAQETQVIVLQMRHCLWPWVWDSSRGLNKEILITVLLEQSIS